MSGVSGWELARERGERIAVLEREREQLAEEVRELRAALVLLRAERDELAAEIAAALLSEVHP